jgi:hypothetical protein
MPHPLRYMRQRHPNRQPRLFHGALERLGR